MTKVWQKLSLSHLAELLCSGKLPLSQYLFESLDRIEKVDTALHALLPEPQRRKRLLQEAESLIKAYPDPRMRPPLWGVLIGIKDLFNVDKMPTRAGSKLPPSAFEGEEAAVVRTLKEAGALVLGKTVSTEFAYFSPGKTRNPINHLYSPGGSSSGSAAAVSAGFCPLALGTQTIASIIRPAAYCGVFGFKASSGRISNAGLFPFSQTMDQIGFFCRSLEDIIFAASIILPDWKQRQVHKKTRLAIPEPSYLKQASRAALQSFQSVQKKLLQADYEIVQLPLCPDIDALNLSHNSLIAIEFAQNHEHLYHQYAQLYSPKSVELFEKGMSALHAGIYPALIEEHQKRKQYIIEQMKEQQIDMWLAPSATGIAPWGLSSTGSPLMSLPFTHAGLASLSMPIGKGKNSLPYGVQLVGITDADEDLLWQAQDILAVLKRSG